MKHLGDITAINGYEIPIVDIITGGSPCQDLSVAGKGAGLAGERSSLFMEQIRIIKEMREHDKELHSGRTAVFVRPRYMVWENVLGAFTSNKGDDFRRILEEIAKIGNCNSRVPGPANGKWAHAGCIVGDGWTIAWRVHDAQFWGVPQRRKRIALVADFGGYTAPEILFERKSVFGDSAQGEKIREKAPERIRGCVNENSGGTLIYSKQNFGSYKQHTKFGTCKARDYKGTNDIILSFGNGQAHDAVSPTENVSKTLNCMKDTMKIVTDGKARLNTPLEYERLQGFPDGWTAIGEWIDSKGKRHKNSDSERFKAIGNSIATPFWEWLARRICAQYERTVSLGSLFDGIGGFPYVFEKSGACAVWASEIDEFAVAVTKKHFPEEG